MLEKREVIFVEVSMASSNPNLPSSGIEALKITKQLGYKPVVLAQEPSFYKPLEDKIDEWIPCNTSDINDVIRKCEDRPLACITTFSDLFVHIANKAAHFYGLYSVENKFCAALARDKSIVRKETNSLDDLSNVLWAEKSLDEDINTSPIGYPCIVKPVDGSASWDVQRVLNDSELTEVIASQRQRTTFGRGITPKRKIIFEEEILGDLYSVEGFIDNENMDIWGYHDRLEVPPPYYYEVGKTFSNLPPREGIEDFTRSILDATGYTFGPFHLEFILTLEGPKLVELNPRLIGGGAHQCIDFATDKSIVEFILRKYLDLPTKEITFKRFSTLLDLYPEATGKIKDINNLKYVKTLTGIIDVIITKKIGDNLEQSKSNSDKIGYIIGVGDSYEKSVHNVKQAEKNLEIVIEQQKSNPTR